MTAIVAFIGLGSNLNEPRERLVEAVEHLQALDSSQVRGISAFYRSPAVGPGEQPDYCNAAVMLETSLSARELLDALLAIEAKMGRARSDTRWMPREIDLDLLLYGDQSIAEEGLHVPHPQLALRDFVLRPLLDLMPDCPVPGQGSLKALWETVPDNGVVRWDANPE